MKKITLENYKKDKFYPRITRATHAILQRKNFVAPVDVLVEMQLLGAESVEAWRFGRIAYLERAIRCTISEASRILRILCFHAHDPNLKPSQTAYKQWVEGRGRTRRFTKTGDANLEEAYSRHFVRLGKNQPPANQSDAASSPEKIDLRRPEAYRSNSGEARV